LPEFAFPGDTLIPVVVFDFISRLPSSFGHKGDDRVPLAQSTNRFLTWIVMDDGANLIFVCHHSPSQVAAFRSGLQAPLCVCRAALTWPPLSRERPLDGADAAAAHAFEHEALGSLTILWSAANEARRGAATRAPRWRGLCVGHCPSSVLSLQRPSNRAPLTGALVASRMRKQSCKYPRVLSCN
jgi:hypothetical protein